MNERAQEAWSSAKNYLRILLVVQVFALGIALWAAWTRPEHGPMVALPILFGVLFPMLSYELRSRVGDAYRKAEMWRRDSFLENAFGDASDRQSVAHMLLEGGERGRNFERKPLGSYYASTKEHGHERLLDNLAESAFYTARIAGSAARFYRFVVALVIFLLLAVMMGLLLAPAIDDTTEHWLVSAAPRFANAASIVLATLASGQAVTLASSYAKLAEDSRAVLAGALAARKAPSTLANVMSLLGSYDCSLAAAGVPLPELAARRHAVELNTNWLEVMAKDARSVAVSGKSSEEDRL